MKTTNTLVGRAHDEKRAIKDLIKELEARSPRTPKIEASIEELNDRVLQLSHAITDHRVQIFLAPVKKWKEHAQRHSQTQRKKRGNRQTWNGLTKEQRSARNQKIAEHFKKASQNGRISQHGFAVKYAEKYGLKTKQTRKIIKSLVGTQPG